MSQKREGHTVHPSIYRRKSIASWGKFKDKVPFGRPNKADQCESPNFGQASVLHHPDGARLSFKWIGKLLLCSSAFLW